MTQPSVLVVTSAGSEPSVVTPVLAALSTVGVDVRAVDVGRAGSKGEGAVDRFVRAIVGELAERRLDRELLDHSVDLALAFEAASVRALCELRDDNPRPIPIVAVVPELNPSAAWAETRADRYLVCDDDAAVSLADLGIDGDRIVPVGPITGYEFVVAAQAARSTLRAKFGIDGSLPVVLIDVDGFGAEATQQLALQLSLMSRPAVFLFDAGGDTEAAAALRRHVPTLGLKAKLFGHSAEAPRYWRAADVVVARPTLAAVARSMTLGSRFIGLCDQGGAALARAVEGRGIGASAASPLLVSQALEATLAKAAHAPFEREDGAGTVADIAFVVASDSDAIIAESRAASYAQTRERIDRAAAYTAAHAQTQRVPGELEDLSGGGDGFAAQGVGDAPDAGELSGLRSEVAARLSQTERMVAAAGAAAETWDQKAASFRDAGNADGARTAAERAQAERTRMHALLAEMADLHKELATLDKAVPAPGGGGSRTSRPPPREPRAAPSRPPSSDVDDLLEQMKQGTGGAPPKSAGRRSKADSKPASTVEDELAALKRRMNLDKRRK